MKGLLDDESHLDRQPSTGLKEGREQEKEEEEVSKKENMVEPANAALEIEKQDVIKFAADSQSAVDQRPQSGAVDENLAKQTVDEDKDAFEATNVPVDGEDEEEVPACHRSFSTASESSTSCSVSSMNGRDSAPSASLAGNTSSNDQSRQQTIGHTSKLRRATRALLLFRNRNSQQRQQQQAHKQRITGESIDELGSGDESTSRDSTQRAPLGRVHQLAASFSSFWRQNNGSNSNEVRNGSRPTLRRWTQLTSSKSSNYVCGSASSVTNEHGAVSSSSCAIQRGTDQHEQNSCDNQQRPRNQEVRDSRQASTSSATTCLPRFIVPKMNALKFPIVCLVRSLEGELMREIFVHRYELGQYLMDNLKVSLGIEDAKYFGLKLALSIEDQEGAKQPWLDMNESVSKQISKFGSISKQQRSASVAQAAQGSQQQRQSPNSSAFGSAALGAPNLKSVDFYLRIKYYPPNLARVQDPFLRQYLFLQLRRDLRLGKLTSSMNNLTLLMACVLQFELGDYKPELVSERLSKMNILPNQDMIEQQALAIWQERLGGLRRHQVQMQFLRASVILETYGFDYYPVRDHQLKRGYLLGFNYAGVKTIRNGRIVHHFRWHSISKIAYERRMIIFHIYPNENSKRKETLGFKCLSNDECQNLYMRLLEQKYFFTVDLAYFDKSIRRPSHLTESSVNSAQAEQQLDWTTSSSSPPLTQQQRQPVLRTIMDEQHSDVLIQGRQHSSEIDDERDEFASMVRSPDASSASEHDQLSNRLTELGTRRAILKQRGNSFRTSSTYQSNSLESTQLDLESLARTGSPNLSASTQLRQQRYSPTLPSQPPTVGSKQFEDDCPDCRREQQQQEQQQEQQQRRDQYGASQGSNHSEMSSTLKHRPQAPLLKTSSLQEQYTKPSALQPEAPPAQETNAGSLKTLACVDAPPMTIGSPEVLELRRQAAYEATATHHNRASLQRQSSTWTNSPTPPPTSIHRFNAFTQASSENLDSTWQQQGIEASMSSRQAPISERISARLVGCIEWLFVQPLIQAHDCSTQPTSSTPSEPVRQPTVRHLLAQALRFCLLVVTLNFLVRLSDFVSSILLNLLTFKNGEQVPNGAQQAQQLASVSTLNGGSSGNCLWSSNVVT